MLLGRNGTGDIIDLSRLTKKEIALLRGDKWTCLCCGASIVVKNGPVMMSHFAHKQGSECTCFSENESVEHLKGKALIAETCRKNGLLYELEAYLPELKQRPDVLIYPHLAIEFQCSSLSIDRMVERTTSYQQAGYEVVWILGNHLHVKQSISKLQKRFISLSCQIGFYVWGLDVEKEEMIVTYFLQNNGGKLTYRQKRWPVLSTSMAHILSYPTRRVNEQTVTCSPLGSIYAQRSKWRNEVMRESQSIRELQTFFYERYLNVCTLPIYLLVPTIGHSIVPYLDYRIRYDVWRFLCERTSSTLDDIVEALLIEKENLSLETLPLIDDERLIRYSVSLHMRGLICLGLIELKGNVYGLKKATVKDDHSLSKLLENKQEILSIPLKYDMINK
ncbi:MAG: competence protein CoiA [Vagococcus sp.]